MTLKTSTFPAVTPELLDDVVQRILDVGSPRRIVLFGSRARGDARRNSDLDLLIIETQSFLGTGVRLGTCGRSSGSFPPRTLWSGRQPK